MDKKQSYIELIKTECLKQHVDTYLFCAIVDTESSWIASAIRYEKDYPYIFSVAKYAAIENITQATETILQQMSFGLCQLMGANARAMGYEKPLMNLLDPAENIPIGVAFFKKRCDIHPDIKDKISSYNAGSPIKKDDHYMNQGYVDKVYSAYLKMKL